MAVLVASVFAEETGSDSDTSDQSDDSVNERRVERVQKMEERREKVAEIRETWEGIRDRVKTVREEHRNVRSTVNELKDKVRGCRKEGNCTAPKMELKRGVRLHLVKTAELIDRSLEKLQQRVEKAEKLSAEEKESALASIAVLEEKLTAQQQIVEAMTANATNAEVRAAVQDLKKLWQDVRTEQRRMISVLLSSKVDTIIEKQDTYRQGMEERIAEIKALGKDTTVLQTHLDEFVRIQTELKQKATELTEGDTEESLRAIHALAKENKEHLHLFLKEYRSLKGETAEE